MSYCSIVSRWIKRESIKEVRNGYFVEYSPADHATVFAMASLTFVQDALDTGKIKEAMEHELQCWLARFRVPLYVVGWDEKDDMIRVDGESSLMGFVSESGGIVKKWGTMENNEFPTDQITEEYRGAVYKSIPSTIIDTDARKVEVMREARSSYRGAMVIFTLIVVIPLLFEAVALGWSLLGNIAGAISFLVGLYKAAKRFGWIKKSQTEIDEEERQRKMRHYFYHCEKNPQGFARLVCETYDRENSEKNRREFERLKAQQTISESPVL